MKKIVLVLLVGLLVVWAQDSFAVINATRAFNVSVNVPAASGINIVATTVNSSNNQFGAQVAGNALSFDTLTYNTQFGIWLPDHYFAIDVGAIGGAGNPNVTVTYGSESSPTGQVKGLGYKATAAFFKVTGATGSQVETSLAAHGKKLLKNLTGENVAGSEVAGAFLRIYLGLISGDASTPADGEPFTNGDKSGLYQGTLTVSATIP